MAEGVQAWRVRQGVRRGRPRERRVPPRVCMYIQGRVDGSMDGWLITMDGCVWSMGDLLRWMNTFGNLSYEI